MQEARRVFPLLACILLLAQGMASSQEGQGEEGLLRLEAFRLRIANTLHGPVQISLNRGEDWMLVARVTRAATATAPGPDSALREVVRSSAYGMAFGCGYRQVARVLPDTPTARRDRAAILLNVPMTSALFKDLLPPVGSSVQLVTSLRALPSPLPSGYTPRDEDVLEFTIRQSPEPPENLESYARGAQTLYYQRALARLRAAGRRPTFGALTVTARLRPGDQPNAVTFLLDGSVAAIMNRAPFSMRWNTRDWPNGEHLIEVRALNGSGVTVSHTKALVVVQNPPAG